MSKRRKEIVVQREPAENAPSTNQIHRTRGPSCFPVRVCKDPDKRGCKLMEMGLPILGSDRLICGKGGRSGGHVTAKSGDRRPDGRSRVDRREEGKRDGQWRCGEQDTNRRDRGKMAQSRCGIHLPTLSTHRWANGSTLGKGRGVTQMESMPESELGAIDACWFQ